MYSNKASLLQTDMIQHVCIVVALLLHVTFNPLLRSFVLIPSVPHWSLCRIN